MITECEAFAGSHGLRFNASKTQLICFRRTPRPVYSHFWFDGQLLPLVDSVLHLGNTLQINLSDKLDIQLKTMAFIRKANSVLFCFKCTDPRTKMRLFQSYCLSLYGSSLWRLDCDELNSLSVSFNNVIRRIWNLPRASHTSVVHSVDLVGSIHNIIYSRFSSLCTSAASHPSCLIRTIFTDNSNYIGYNYLYGASYCKSYSPHDVATLIREIRSESVILIMVVLKWM